MDKAAELWEMLKMASCRMFERAEGTKASRNQQ
jgi:hypothetical protein